MRGYGEGHLVPPSKVNQIHQTRLYLIFSLAPRRGLRLKNILLTHFGCSFFRDKREDLVVLTMATSPGSAQHRRRGGRRPLLREEDLCCPGEEELSCTGWVLEAVKLTGRQLFKMLDYPRFDAGIVGTIGRI